MNQVTKATVKAAGDVAQFVQQKLIDDATTALNDAVELELRRFLRDAESWFRQCPNGRWSAEGARASLPAIRARAGALQDAIASRFLDTVQQARRRAFVRGVQTAKVTLDRLGVECPERATDEGLRREAERLSESDVDAIVVSEPAEPVPDERRLVGRAVIIENGSVWTMTEPDGEKSGGTMLPGGGVDPGESMQQAAVREAMEETGLLVEITAFLADFHDAYSQRRYYVARRIGGEPTAIDQDGNRPVTVRLMPVDEARIELKSPFDRAAVEMAGPKT